MASDDQRATSARNESREGWQGRRTTVGAAAPQYRWQGGGGRNVENQVARPRRRRRWGLLFWLLVLWGLYGVYVALLAYSPRRTPLLAAVAVEYNLPLPPNAWAREDLDLLVQLNGQNLKLIDTSAAWRTRSAGLAEWEARIEDVRRHGSATRVALFYVSMHGAVDEQGRPCLIPPGVAPLEAQQWIPIDELLKPLGKLPADWRKIVFLDAARRPSNWRLGVYENTFADRLPEAVERLRVPGLVVVNSAGPEQRNWASPDLAGSVFGREVAFALAGCADFLSTQPGRTAGDADGRVTLAELKRYVVRRSRLWALRNRAAVQIPQVLPDDGADFVVAKSLHRSDSSALRAARNARPREQDAAPADRIAALWQKVAGLQSLRPYQGEPIAWRDLQQRLVWLEQLATSGRAYQESTQRVLRDLTTQLERAEEQARAIADRPALAGRTSVLDPRAADWPRQLPLHSLPLCEYFGVVDPADADKLRQQLDELAASADVQQFDARLRAALQSSPRADLLGGLVETHVLKLAQRYRVPQAWNGVTPLQKSLELRQAGDRATTGWEERSHYWTRTELGQADRLRRAAEDRMFAGPEAAGPEPWAPALEAYAKALRPAEGRTARIRAALDVRDRALAELPYWAAWCADSEPFGKPLAGLAEDPIPSEVETTIGAVRKLAGRLTAVPTGPTTEDDEAVIAGAALQIEESLERLARRLDARCRELLEERRQDAPTFRGLESLLDSPLVEADLRRKARLKAQALGARLHQASVERAAGRAKDPIPDPKPLEGARDRLANWPVHPLLALLELDADSSGAAPVERPGSRGVKAGANGGPRGWGDAAAKPASDTEGDTATEPASELAEPGEATESTATAKTEARSKASSDAAGADDPESLADEPAGPADAEWLARWERDAQRVRRRLIELARWAPSLDGAATASVASGSSTVATVSAGSAGSAGSAASAAVSSGATLDDGSTGAESNGERPVAAAEAADESLLGAAVQAARLELARAEYQMRAAAAVGFPAPERSAVRLLRRFDLQQLLIWQAERTLDDFWGAGPKSRSEGPPEAPFYVQAVYDHLKAAEQIGPKSTIVQRQTVALRDRLQRRLAAAAGAVTVDVEPAESSEDLELVQFRVRASGGGGELPRGEGTIFVRQGDDVLEGRRALVELPAAASGDSSNWKTVGGRLKGGSTGGGLQAAVVFRGHEFQRPFFRRGLGGVLVRYEPKPFDSAQIAVLGQRRRQASVLFILDCSASMAREIAVESLGEDRQPRLDVAKGVLQEFLEQLAERGDTRVGVRFFGHRTGWTRSQPLKVLTQADYIGSIPNELAPSEDVELVLPLGRFGPVEAGRVVRLLPSLKPWGQSPLHLSLIQALGDFDSDRNDTERSVVLITDGGNYQFTPSSTAVRGRPSTTMRDVVSAWSGRKVPVHIVGFGLENTDDDLEAEREFRQITDATGGEFFPVQSGQDLMKVLRGRLGLGSYRVYDDRGAPVGRPASAESDSGVRLNQPVRLAGLGGGARKYRLEFESATQPLVLEGGERIDFDVAEDGRRLTVRPYAADVAAALPLVSGGRTLVARLHRPVSDRDGVTFRVSLQDENLEFTRRPDEIWIEITPLASRGERELPTYVFYERNFEPQTPVPVAVCRVPGWPAGAASARIQLWCKFAATPAVLSRSAAELLKQAQSGDEEATPGVPGVTFRVEYVPAETGDALVELRVTERHGPASPGVNALRVQLEAPPDLAPQQVERQADAAAGVVIHSLRMSRDRWQRLLADSRGQLVMTTREATREGAWRTESDRAATIEVTLSSDTLPVQPPQTRP